MKWIAAAFLVCLLAFSAHAYADPVKTAPYLVVVGQTAPASDVIIAANFAASMKGSAAVTFQSAIDQDARGTLTLDDLASKTVVVVNGGAKTVKILGGLHDDAWDNAREYFKNLGFAVIEIRTGYSLDDLLLHPPEVVAPPPAVAPAVPSPPGQGPVANQPSNVSNETLPADVEPQAESNSETAQNTTEPTPTPEQIADIHIAAPPKPGFFARIWNWLASIF